MNRLLIIAAFWLIGLTLRAAPFSDLSFDTALQKAAETRLWLVANDGACGSSLVLGLSSKLL